MKRPRTFLLEVVDPVVARHFKTRGEEGKCWGWWKKGKFRGCGVMVGAIQARYDRNMVELPNRIKHIFVYCRKPYVKLIKL